MLQRAPWCPSRAGRTRGPASRAAPGGWASRPACRILLGLHQPDAEELRPEPVDGDPGRQRVLRVDQPPRQAEPVARGALGERVERGRDAGLDRSPGSRKLPFTMRWVVRRLSGGSSTITGRSGSPAWPSPAGRSRRGRLDAARRAIVPRQDLGSAECPAETVDHRQDRVRHPRRRNSEGSLVTVEPSLQPGELGVDVAGLLLLGRGRRGDDRRLVGLVGVGGLVEEREEAGSTPPA